MSVNPFDEVVQHAAAARVEGTTLSLAEASHMAERIARDFAGLSGHPAWNLWDQFLDASSVRDPEGWRRVGELIGGGPSVLLLNHADRWYGYSFAQTSALQETLGECSGFEFFVVDASFERVICFNHHDTLISARRVT